MTDWAEIFLAVAGTTASVSLSVWQAKKTAKAEIEKLQTIWEHEKEAACDANFDSMVASVSLFAKRPSPRDFEDATNAISIYQAKATGDMAVEVDKLNRMIVRTGADCAAISEQLSVVIACKRKANR